MKQRDQRGRYKRVYRTASRWEVLTFYSVLGGMLLGIALDSLTKPHVFEVVRTVEAAEVVEVPQEVMVEVVYTQEGIEQLIRQTFTETPNTAVAIAKCESGLDPNIQSRQQLSYGQEKSFGIFQIHVPDWADTATILGFNNFQTDPVENIKLARYIYENYGWNMWTCYTKELYKKYL